MLLGTPYVLMPSRDEEFMLFLGISKSRSWTQDFHKFLDTITIACIPLAIISAPGISALQSILKYYYFMGDRCCSALLYQESAHLFKLNAIMWSRVSSST